MLKSCSIYSRMLKIGIVVFICLLFSFSALAQQAVLPKSNIKKPGKQQVNPAAQSYVDIRFESLEVVTTEDNTHQWQVNVKNYSNKSARNFKVTVQGIALWEKNNSERMLGIIPLIGAGQSGFARGPLPGKAGTYKLAIKVGGAAIYVPLPRPFLLDANAKPENALKVNKIWYRRAGGKVFWYLETKPNLYADIPVKKVFISGLIRGRTKQLCLEEKNLEYENSGTWNKQVIKSGQKHIFRGEIQKNNAKGYPKLYDYIILDSALLSENYWIEMDRSMYNDGARCDKAMNYLQNNQTIKSTRKKSSDIFDLFLGRTTHSRLLSVLKNSI